MRRLAASAILALLVCMGSRPLLAQTGEGTITGTVFDTTGAAVPSATVTITNEGTNIATSKTTGSDGAYRFDLVPPGNYTVTTKASGFATTEMKDVVVRASQFVPLNITLEVSKTQTIVEVTSAAPLVQTATSDLTHTVENTQIIDTPLLSRNVYDLIFAIPGVVPGMDSMGTSGGVRESGTTVLLNGSDNNDNFSEGSVNITPPLETVQEYTVLTNQMSAQYGHAAGALVSVEQKTGTNQFHGALYEFNRNRSLNSSNFFQNRINAPKPKYIRNQFGGEIGGPIKHDKTFFMAAYDQITNRQGSSTATQGPTATLLARMQAAAGPNSIASYYLNKYTPVTQGLFPCPNAPASISGDIGCESFFDPVSFPQKDYVGRVDHTFSDKDRLTFVANITRFDSTDKYGGGSVSVVPISGVDGEHYSNFNLVETHTFGPTVYNELTIAQNRHFSKFVAGGGKNVDPQILVDGDDFGTFGFSFGPSEGALVQGFVQDRWQLQDNAGWQKGRHSIKFGGSIQWAVLYRNWDLGLPGQYEFGNVLPSDPSTFVPGGDTIGSGVTPPAGYGTASCPELVPTVSGTTVTSWTCSPSVQNADGSISGNIASDADANFVNDFPYFQEISVDLRTGARGNAYRHYYSYDSGLFAQDDWKVSPRLTLNLGMRWERYGAPREQHDILAQFSTSGPGAFNCLSTANTLDYPTCAGNARIGPAQSMWHTRNYDFGPRIGLAWDVFGDQKTSLRAGYGIFYDRIFDNVWSNGAWNPPFYGLFDGDASGPGGDTIFYQRPALPPAGFSSGGVAPDFVSSRVSVRTMEQNLKDSSDQSLYFGLERQLSPSLALTLNYQGSLGRHLPVLMNWNRFDGEGYNRNLSEVRPNSHYTGFNYRSNNVSSSYNALVIEARKHYSHGLALLGGYTWGRLMDFGSDLFTGSTQLGGFSQPFYFISNDHKNLEYGPGAFDHRHSFKLNVTYELPFMKEQRGVLGKVAGGWQLSGFYQYYYGHPINVTTGGVVRGSTSSCRFAGRDAAGNRVLDPNGNTYNIGFDLNLDRYCNDHPDFVGGNANSIYSHANPADGIFKDLNPISCGPSGLQGTDAVTGLPATVSNIGDCNANYYGAGQTTFNSLFAEPPGFGVRFGRLGRNLFHGPGFNGFDGAVFKNIAVNERWKLQIRIEALNLPNHPNFDAIDSDLMDVGNFGKAQILVGNAPSRIFQLGARLTF